MKASSSTSRASSSRATPLPATASFAANCCSTRARSTTPSLWEYSLLRLNQLEYFEPLKVDQDSEAHQNAEAGTVDLLLKVKEKGKNSIGLNGGVSGLSGAFLGINYQTNNFLGLGETLSVQGNIGNVSRQFLFGFSQPYVHNQPLNVGFQIYNNKSDFNAAKYYQTTTGTALNLSAAQESLTQNYNQAATGLNFSLSYPLRRHAFQRVGFTYSLSRANDHRFQHGFANLLPDHQFPFRHSGLERAGRHRHQPGFVSPIPTTPSIILCGPVRARKFTAALQVAGIWGNVRYFSPLVAFKTYRSMHYLTSIPMATTCSPSSRSSAISRDLAATWRRPTTASTPAATRNCAASTCAAPRPMAMCPPARPCSSPIRMAPASRAIPTIRS